MVRKLPFRTVPFQEWLPDDQLAWHTATYLSDLFDDPGPLSHASPEHQVKLIAAHGRWLGFLEEHTRRAAPEGDRETIEVFIKLLSEFLAPHSVFHYCRDLCLVLQAIHPRHELPTLETAVRNLARTRRAVTDKRSRLVPVAELYALGHDLMHEPVHHEVALKRAATYRDGLMIALLSSRPMRLKNLASIEIGRHLDRRGRRYWLDFPAREVKNRRALEFPLPHELTEYIETYLSEVRPVLLEGYGRWKCDPGEALWISEHGSKLLAGQIRKRISRRTRERFDRKITPHLFRDAAATSVAVNDPEHVGMIIAILGHSTITIAERYYNQASSLEAARRLQNVVMGLRTKNETAEASP